MAGSCEGGGHDFLAGRKIDRPSVPVTTGHSPKGHRHTVFGHGESAITLAFNPVKMPGAAGFGYEDQHNRLSQ